MTNFILLLILWCLSKPLCCLALFVLLIESLRVEAENKIEAMMKAACTVLK